MSNIHYQPAHAEKMTDIYSCSRTHRQHTRQKKSGKKALLSLCVGVPTVAVVALVSMFAISKLTPAGSAKSTVFSDHTVVSGVDISGKTKEEAAELLTAHESDFIRPVSLTVDVDGQSQTLTQDNFTYTYDIDKVLTSLMNDEHPHSAQNSDADTAQITATPTADSIAQQAQAIADTFDREPTDASVAAFHPFAEERFELNESQDGLQVNVSDLSDKITAFMNGTESSGAVEAQTQSVPASLSSDELRSKLVVLGTYHTYTTTDTDERVNATHNMETSLNACNQYNEIKPGDTWSFNTCTGDSNQESNGYLPATVIAGGDYAMGVGGGICQASSTIYEAAIRANLDIVERDCHKWASSYVPTGLDATIDYGYIDLKLQNNSEHSVYLECRLVDNTLYATFWGYKSDSYDQIVICNQDGGNNESDTAFYATAWREYYKDGVMIGSEELPSSKYVIDSAHAHTFRSADNDEQAQFIA